MPDVLYEMLIPDNAIVGSILTIRIDSNSWSNDTSDSCSNPTTVLGKQISVDYCNVIKQNFAINNREEIKNKSCYPAQRASSTAKYLQIRKISRSTSIWGSS